MTIDERSRHALYLRLEAVLGPDEAGTLMDHLPPVGWSDVATRRDVDGASALVRSELASESALLRSEVTTEFALVRSEMAAQVAELRSEMAAQTTELRSEMTTGFTVLQAQVDGVRTEMRAMEQSLVGLFRMELAQAITSQTRTLVVAMITLMVAAMSLAFTAAQLG